MRTITIIKVTVSDEDYAKLKDGSYHEEANSICDSIEAVIATIDLASKLDPEIAEKYPSIRLEI